MKHLLNIGVVMTFILSLCATWIVLEKVHGMVESDSLDVYCHCIGQIVAHL